MKQPKGTMPQSLVDKIIMQAMIDSILYDTREEFRKIDPYSLTPIRENLRFKHGQAKLPKAYKETKPLKSVLESEMFVSEVPVKDLSGEDVVFDGLYTNEGGKIQVEIPGIEQACFISERNLKQLVSKYGGKSYNAVENGRRVIYKYLCVDIKILLKYCEIG